MIYVPADLEQTVRAWVKTYRRAEELTERISQSCLDRSLKDKAQARTGGTRR